MDNLVYFSIPTTVELMAQDDKLPTITGYALRYNVLSADYGGFKVRLLPGAFTKSLKKADVRALWNHSDAIPLGRVKAGTLRLSDDETGLRVEVDPPPTELGRSVVAAIERGDVDGFSFGMYVQKEKWSEFEGYPVNDIVQGDLFEVSPVNFPAFDKANFDMQLASLHSWKASLPKPRLELAKKKLLVRLK